MHACLEKIFMKSWWVVLFVLCCYFGYEQGLLKKNDAFAKLQNQYDELLQKKTLVLKQQESLVRHINSQNDNAWLELVLMNELGLVPEGQTKVFFTNKKELLKDRIVK